MAWWKERIVLQCCNAHAQSFSCFFGSSSSLASSITDQALITPDKTNANAPYNIQQAFLLND